jgi:hypothetical protein
VLEEANSLSKDLMEEELTGTKTHKELSVQPKNQFGCTTKKLRRVQFPVGVARE